MTDLKLRAERYIRFVLFKLLIKIYRLDDFVGLKFRKARNAFRWRDRFFDEDWYGEHNPDLSSVTGDLLQHYKLRGFEEGRPARYFDAIYYMQAYPDLKISTLDAFSHYRRYGADEGRLARFNYVRARREWPPRRSFSEWLEAYDADSLAEQKAAVGVLAAVRPTTAFRIWIRAPKESVAFGGLEACLQSLLKQSYTRWAGIVIGNYDQPGLGDLKEKLKDESRLVFINPDEAINILRGQKDIQGDYECILDWRYLLSPNALFWMALDLEGRPDVSVVYGDEDRQDASARRYEPYFKTDFNYELFLTHNLFGGFAAYAGTVFKSLGLLPEPDNGATQYEMAFKAIERVDPGQILHIPVILSHRRHGVESVTAHLGVVQAHLIRSGCEAYISEVQEASGFTRVHYSVPANPPHVTIIIPTRDRLDLLAMCLESLQKVTRDDGYDVVIVDNGSVERATLDYLASLDPARFTVVRHDKAFNYSELNNLGVSHARGEYVCLLNNDIEFISPNWLGEMLSFAVRLGTGCVGARLWYPDDTIQHAGVLLGFHGIAGHMHKHLVRGDAGYASRAVLHQELSAVTGAALMISKAIYTQVGGLDERLAVAFNDVDFCLRVMAAGYRNIYTPYAEMYHHESASRGADLTPEKRQRERLEIDLMRARYGESLMLDPAYNPNLSLKIENFSLAAPPRRFSAQQLLEQLGKQNPDITQGAMAEFLNGHGSGLASRFKKIFLS